MIKVCGHRILVRPILLNESDDVFKAAKAVGLSIIRNDEKREAESVDQGVVVQVGPTAWKDFNTDPWCKEGDTIVYAKFAGKKVTDPDSKEDYVVLNDEDVVCIVEESK